MTESAGGFSDAADEKPTPSDTKAHDRPGRGAVAIIVESEKFLVIRRSLTVRAPNKLCFAGGTIEYGETPHVAVVRELHEELQLRGTAKEHVWQSVTRWGTQLEWIMVERAHDSQPIANPSEVSEWMWLTGQELLEHPHLLPSVPAFYRAWAHGEFVLPERAGSPHPDWKNL